jgi:ABC-type iron transport system FetAB permease component
MMSLNMMILAGLIALPGTRRGQILAGADPDQAAKCQIVVMFVSAGAAELAALSAARGGVWCSATSAIACASTGWRRG